MDVFDPLRKKNLMLILTYAPAGLGHLRVTNALASGLPDDIIPVLLGAEDTSITFIHRATSINPTIRAVVEWIQQGFPQQIFTTWYRWYLRSTTSRIYKQILRLVKQKLQIPDTIVILSTHFGLAHQLAHIKNSLARATGTKIILAMVITDDSPQHIWYVPGVDVIFAPSLSTIESLRTYGKSAKLSEVRFELSAYPVSKNLIQSSPDFYENRILQSNPDESIKIHIAVPISGAAVGMRYTKVLLDTLYERSNRFLFHITVKDSLHTTEFKNYFRTKPYAIIQSSTHDRGVVDLYDLSYNTNPVLLEITKPSEQAFKSLITPGQYGGSILLLSEPVGRQEHDNVRFLIRHNLMPSELEMADVLTLARNSTQHLTDSFLRQSEKWRAFRIPDDPIEAAQFILWCLRQRIFSHMVSYRKQNYSPECDREISVNGVQNIWETIIRML